MRTIFEAELNGLRVLRARDLVHHREGEIDCVGLDVTARNALGETESARLNARSRCRSEPNPLRAAI
jgi:hypothetical protein